MRKLKRRYNHKIYDIVKGKKQDQDQIKDVVDLNDFETEYQNFILSLKEHKDEDEENEAVK